MGNEKHRPGDAIDEPDGRYVFAQDGTWFRIGGEVPTDLDISPRERKLRDRVLESAKKAAHGDPEKLETAINLAMIAHPELASPKMRKELRKLAQNLKK